MATTGVISNNNIAWEFVDNEICLDCEEAYNQIDSNEDMDEDEKDHEMEFIECDSSHTKLLGDWLKDENGLWYPDPDGEFAAIEREFNTQVVYSKYTKNTRMCSPCYPGQGDLDNEDENGIESYNLPDWMLRKDEE